MSAIKLKAEPDGLGYIYGTVRKGDMHQRVDILPPASDKRHWSNPFIVSGATEPDPQRWTVFLDGEEVGRVATRDDIAALIGV